MRMTHMEYFNYDIIEYLTEGKMVCKKTVLLFDYQRRNRLNRQAEVMDITEMIEQLSCG